MASQGIAAILYDFNVCDDFIHSYYRVVQEVFIPSANIAFNATKSRNTRPPIQWNAFRCDKPRRQQTGRHNPSEIPLNAKDVQVPDELVKTLVAYVQAKEAIDTKWAEAMTSLTGATKQP